MSSKPLTAHDPIAVFDSGVGGLTVVHQLHSLLPHEQIIYFGDSLRAPYGGRSTEVIKEFSCEITRFLLTHSPKIIVIACNTVSAVALDSVQKVAGDIPVIGVVAPGCEGAIQQGVKRVGVIGTRATIEASAYQRGIAQRKSSLEVFEKACPLLAPLVEEGFAQSEVAVEVLQVYLKDLLATGIDSLVLGCTHYPLLLEALSKVVGDDITIIDSAYWTALEIRKELESRSLCADRKDKDDIYYTSDLTDQFTSLATTFLQERIGTFKSVTHNPMTIQE